MRSEEKQYIILDDIGGRRREKCRNERNKRRWSSKQYRVILTTVYAPSEMRASLSEKSRSRAQGGEPRGWSTFAIAIALLCGDSLAIYFPHFS